MLNIDRLRLCLPAGFEPRARGIVRLLADELAAFEAPAARRIGRLSLGPVEIQPGASDRDVARSMARAVASAAGLRKRGRP